MQVDPFENPDDLDDLDDPGEARPGPTGVTRVDAVITAVAELGDRPLEEHARVFELAHDELRRTLDDPEAGQDDH